MWPPDLHGAGRPAVVGVAERVASWRQRRSACMPSAATATCVLVIKQEQIKENRRKERVMSFSFSDTYVYC
jgi:hypothetical protein